MKVLVVGGAGYVGGALTDLLRNSEHEILVYDLFLYEESYRKPVPFVYGDIRDRAKLKRYLEWADVVVWLAALVGDPACSLNEALTLQINRDSVEYLRQNCEGRIIFTSSCSVYGAGGGILTEDSELRPLSLYAKTKVWAEQILADSNALSYRLGTLYGLGDTYSRIRFDLVVNTLVMRAMFHGKISVFGGAQYRPLLHVRDAAAAISLAIEKTNTGIYNLHSENTRIIDIADQMKEHFPMLQIEVRDTILKDNRNYFVSSEKAQRELGFQSTLTIKDGIKELKAMLEQGRIKNSFVNRFSNYLYLKPLLDEYSSPLGKEIKLNV